MGVVGMSIEGEYLSCLSEAGDCASLSGKWLTQVPDLLCHLTSLKELDLSHNRLIVLPDWMSNLTSLTSLNLSDNWLIGMPDWIGNFTSLTSLNLSYNGLIGMPDWIGNLTSLTSLDLSSNQLIGLPDWLGNFTSLTSLNLGSNRLAGLPDWLGNLTSLTSLNLGSNRLAGLPDWLGNLTSLTSLDLSGNRLARLPDWLGNLTSLTSLDLSSTRLIGLPDRLSNLTSLASLDLSSNVLIRLPDWLGNLTSLTSLNLRRNGLSELPDWLGNLTSLTSLDLGSNRLAGLPDWLGNLTSLASLDLSSNVLIRLPDWLGNLTSLTSLNLGSNGLSELPDWLGNLTSLTSLDLSGNQLTELPDWLGNLTSLTSLDLSGNQLTELPDWLGNLTSLTSLNLGSNGLSELPDWLGNLTSLTSLDLSGNQLTELPDWLGNLTSLTSLNLGSNGLAGLPDWLGNLTSLTSLNLGSNGLAGLPDWLGNLTSLTSLNLGSNGLAGLPDWLGNLTSLTSLNLSRNQLAGLPDSLGNLTFLTILDLSGNQLAWLPDWLGNFTFLNSLSLTANQLSELPEWLGNLRYLFNLNLNGNRLTELPDSLGNLTILTNLSVSDNRLTELPDSMNNHTILDILDLDNNQLRDLPDWLGNFTSLTNLDLSGNRLIELPDSLANLTSLYVLRLGDNRLSELPDWLGNLKSLRSLDLSKNDLKVLPSWLGSKLMTGLQIELDGNPLNEPALELFRSGIQALAGYLQSLTDAKPQYEAKLILVGEGNVGKTSLLAALKNEGFIERRPTTHGIEISPLTLRHPSLGLDMTVRAWDFGGQEVYRITHQFFYSQRALYMVVWNARQGQEQDEVEGWLRRIRLRVGPEAQAMVTATHCDERLPELDYPHLEHAFPGMLAGSFNVDSRTGTGIDQLRHAIGEQAARLPQMGQLISPRWVATREEILSLGESEPQIWYDQFVEVCEQHGVTGSEISALARLMHDLGHIIYYADDDGLRDVVVLNPEWLTKAISYVLEDASTRNAEGVLDHRRLREIWRDQHYPSRYHRYFLRLMEKFDISYRLEGDEVHSLIAQLVPLPPPSLPWQANTPLPAGFRKLALVCRLSEPAPGLVPWLTVRHHRSSTGRHWRRGVFLRHPIVAYSSEALLELRYNGELALEVRAPSPDLYFNVLRYSIEDLITTRWPGLTYQLLVPCPGLADDRTPCPGHFRLATLERFREAGKTSITCNDCIQDFGISDLLTGFAVPSTPLAEQLDQVSGQLADIKSSLKDDFVIIHGQVADIAETVRRVQRVISTEITDCPRLFTLRKEVPTGPRRVRFYQDHYRLTLWCEHPGYWHPWEEASYELDPPKEWFTEVAPYLLLMVRTLQLVVPLTGAIAVAGLPASQLDQAQAHLDVLTTLMADLPSDMTSKTSDGDLKQTTGQLTLAEGEALRALRTIVFQHDQSHAFGGMHRVQAPYGDLLWVCPDHYPEYDPGLPYIPA